jgi:ABC-type Zn2+ transport system substrate-binding protein/surface adhesin
MDKSIFDNEDLFYRPMSPCICSNSFEKERVIAETKEQMRKEFIEVYSKNEEYYQKYVADLNKQLEERNKTIQQLVELLHKK